MSARVKRYLPTLKAILRLSPQKRRRLLANCPKDLMDIFCECTWNVIKGNIKLTPAQLRKLRRQRKSLRALVARKTSLKKKRKIIQKGGFIGGILGPVLSVLAPAIGGLLSGGR